MGVEPRLLTDYRNAFSAFARQARQTRTLMAAANADWQAIDAALLELEKARVNYNQHRDHLAQQLLPPQADRVRAVAELRWELAGKPEGTDDENWYRAEEIVRCATAV